MKKSHFLLLNLAIAFLFSNGVHAEDDAELDVRTSSCSRKAIAENVNSWAKSSKSTLSQNSNFHKTLYESLQSCGVFPSSIPFEKQAGKSIFSTPQLHFDGSVELSLAPPSSPLVLYRITKRHDGEYDVDEVELRSRGKGPKRLYGANMTTDERKEAVQRLLTECKMADPKILKVIKSRVGSWFNQRRQDQDPSPSCSSCLSSKQRYEGYSQLFNDLKANGIFKTNAQYVPNNHKISINSERPCCMIRLPRGLKTTRGRHHV